MTLKYLVGAEPLFLKGSKKGLLLLHGAGGGSSWDLKEFAHQIHSQTGLTIWLPTLTGWGTQPEDLYQVTFLDWLNDGRNGIKKLSQECTDIFIVGHSMGGVLALILASEFHKIRAVVTWAAAAKTKTQLLFFLPFIMKIPLIKHIIPEKYPSPAPEYLKEKGWVGYDWIPFTIGFTILDGLKTLKKSIPSVKCPLLIIQGTNDEVVSQSSPEYIYKNVQSEVKKIWMVKGATHPIMNEELYKSDLFQQTITFLYENGL